MADQPIPVKTDQDEKLDQYKLTWFQLTNKEDVTELVATLWKSSQLTPEDEKEFDGWSSVDFMNEFKRLRKDEESWSAFKQANGLPSDMSSPRETRVSKAYQKHLIKTDQALNKRTEWMEKHKGFMDNLRDMTDKKAYETFYKALPADHRTGLINPKTNKLTP